MNKPSPIRFLIGVGGAAALLLSSNAFAGDKASRIWVDARPWTCANEVGAFARQISLACDSIGGACEVAADAKQAQFRAALACGEQESWKLVLQKSDGSEVLSLNLEGDREQRLRKAATWVAHASAGEPPPRRAKPSAASVPIPVPAEPPAELPADEDEPAVIPVPVPPPPAVVVPLPAAPEAKPGPVDEKRGGLAVSGFAGLTSRRGVVAGGRVYAAFPLGAGFALAPVFNYARGLSRDDRGNLLLGGGMLGWGAPFGGRWLGFSIEGGAGGNVGRSGGFGGGDDRFDGRDGRDGGGSSRRPAFYGRAAGILQFPVEFPVRPFVSIAGMHVSNQFGRPAQTAMLDIGFAWRAF